MNIKETFCLWCDLLGYGKPFIDAGWNLYDERVLLNIERISRLKDMFQSANNYPIEKSLIMNDGFIRSMDIISAYNGTQQNYLYWFNQVLNNFLLLNRIDKNTGFPGARAVLTYGHRFEYMSDRITAADVVFTSPENIPKYEKNTIVYSPKEFQMNTAFSKAYIMEDAGSKVGLKGANLYIDIDFLKKMKEILEFGSAYYLLSDEDRVRIDDKGWHHYPIKEQLVFFAVDTFEDDEFTIWQVKQKIDDKETVLFKLWMDKQHIDFKQKGINTKLFKAIKYKPFDEDNLIIELG